MATKKTYIQYIRAQVKANHGGKVPDYLNLTIQQYADALELKDHYREKVLKEGAVIYERGSNEQPIRKQHPLCNLIYQQEVICQKFAKDLGLTAAKAAIKPKGGAEDSASSSLDNFINGIIG